jgi:hypothetical protein
MEQGGEAGTGGGLGNLRALLAILQWWGFNVTVIIINKWIFQVQISSLSLDPSPSFLSLSDSRFHSPLFNGYPAKQFNFYSISPRFPPLVNGNMLLVPPIK